MPAITGPGADRIRLGLPISAPDRKAEQAIRHLQGFMGTLRVDSYAGYKVLAERNAVSLAFRWSHVRRKFYELAQSGPAPIAAEALARIATLYQVEDEIRGRPAEERWATRQARNRPIVAALEPRLKEKLGLVSQKSKLAETIRYALSRWEGLGLFLDDGRVEIDSNTDRLSIRVRSRSLPFTWPRSRRANQYRNHQLPPQLLDHKLLRLHLPMAGRGLRQIGGEVPNPFAQDVLVRVQIARHLRQCSRCGRWSGEPLRLEFVSKPSSAHRPSPAS